MTSPAALTELCMSLAALLGLVTLHRLLHLRNSEDPINRRFVFCIRLTMLLFTGRVLLELTGWNAFRIPILLGAALIPLGALLLTEGLLRRHAPQSVKLFVAVGTIVFLISAFWYAGSIDPFRLYALLAFQVIGFCLAGWLIIARDRTSLSPQENTTATRLGLSLLVFVPLTLGDFLKALLGLPIQFSALGVLILCWLAIGLARAQTGHRIVIANFTVTVAASVLVGLLVADIAQLDREAFMLCTAVVMTALFLVFILNDARALRSESQSIGLLRYLAEAGTNDPVAFLRDLSAHPMVDGAALINPQSLAGLQDETLGAIFAAAPVLRRADPPRLGAVADDHIAYLFDRYSATHVILAATSPRVLIALSMPSLSASPMAELELQVVQRMAALMSRPQETKG